MTLAITALTRKTAILQLIRQCHAERPGTPVLLTVLMVAWTQMGLRGDPDHKNPSVALSESGKAWMDGVGADPHLRMEQERILRSVRQRVEARPEQAMAPGQVPRWHIVDRRVRFD